MLTLCAVVKFCANVSDTRRAIWASCKNEVFFSYHHHFLLIIHYCIVNILSLYILYLKLITYILLLCCFSHALSFFFFCFLIYLLNLNIYKMKKRFFLRYSSLLIISCEVHLCVLHTFISLYILILFFVTRKNCSFFTSITHFHRFTFYRVLENAESHFFLIFILLLSFHSYADVVASLF